MAIGCKGFSNNYVLSEQTSLIISEQRAGRYISGANIVTAFESPRKNALKPKLSSIRSMKVLVCTSIFRYYGGVANNKLNKRSHVQMQS